MKGLHKGCIRKVDNPMKWMEEDKTHFEIKEELQKFLSENEHILNLVGAENESALLLVAEHFTTWQKAQTRDEHFWNGMQHAKDELMKEYIRKDALLEWLQKKYETMSWYNEKMKHVTGCIGDTSSSGKAEAYKKVIEKIESL